MYRKVTPELFKNNEFNCGSNRKNLEKRPTFIADSPIKTLMNLRCNFFQNSGSGYLYIIFFAALSHTSIGQVAVVDNLVTAYHQESNSAYSTQWTIGEIFTGTFESGDVVVSSGINDNSIVYIIMNTESRTMNDAGSYRAFPNPMENIVTVRSEHLRIDEAVFLFSDASGKKVDVPLVSTDEYEATFNTEVLKTGFYLLTIQNSKTRQYAHIKLVQK